MITLKHATKWTSIARAIVHVDEISSEAEERIFIEAGNLLSIDKRQIIKFIRILLMKIGKM